MSIYHYYAEYINEGTTYQIDGLIKDDKGDFEPFSTSYKRLKDYLKTNMFDNKTCANIIDTSRIVIKSFSKLT